MLIETVKQYEESYTSISYDIVIDGVTVGYASVMVDDKSAYCDRIDILKQYRRRGYGTAALYDLSRIYNGVIVAPDNEDARRLYERIGSPSNDDFYDQGFGVFDI